MIKALFSLFYVLLFCVISSIAHGLTITESLNPPEGVGDFIDDGEFIVTNDTAEGVYAFFVSNPSAYTAQIDPVTGPAGWQAVVLTRDVWEAGTIAFPNPAAWTPPDTATLLWGDYFDPISFYAFGYFADVTGGPIAAGATQGGFQFTALQPFSRFVAFGSNGIVAQGEAVVVQAVPIPAAIYLFSTGLIGFVGFTSRKTLRG